MNLEELNDMCLLMARQLHECVAEFAPHKDAYFNVGYKTPKNAQANRTAIRRQVRALRQSLLALEREIGGA